MNNDKNNAIAGAQACLSAIRAMEAIATSDGPEVSYYEQRELMIATLLKAAQPLSPYMQGFIAVLAEYIDLNLGYGHKPAHHWLPEAALSEAELQKSRSQSYATVSSI